MLSLHFTCLTDVDVWVGEAHVASAHKRFTVTDDARDASVLDLRLSPNLFLLHSDGYLLEDL